MAKETAPPITVTAFGKHPAWADHIDNLPAPAPRLAQFKSVFYTNGIDPNVRKWSRPADENTEDDVHSPALDSHLDEPALNLIRFGHRFRYWTPDALILGTLTPSADRKGRKKYPLVIAAQCTRPNPHWLRAHVWPAIERMSTDCPAATSVEEVRALLAGATQRLEEELATSDQGDDAADGAAAPEGAAALKALAGYFATDAPVAGTQDAEPPRQADADAGTDTDADTDADAALADASSAEPATEAVEEAGATGPGVYPIQVVRLLYQIQRFTRSAPKPEGWSGTHMRVPVLSDDPLADMTLYQNVARHMTGNHTSVLTVTPHDRGWIDLVLGSPDSNHYLFLRRSDLPMCTEIAYNLDDAEKQALYEIIDGTPPVQIIKDATSGIFNLGKPAARPHETPAELAGPIDSAQTVDLPPPPKRPSSDQTIQRMLIGIAALIVLIIILVVILVR